MKAGVWEKQVEFLSTIHQCSGHILYLKPRYPSFLQKIKFWILINDEKVLTLAMFQPGFLNYFRNFYHFDLEYFLMVLIWDLNKFQLKSYFCLNLISFHLILNLSSFDRNFWRKFKFNIIMRESYSKYFALLNLNLIIVWILFQLFISCF